MFSEEPSLLTHLSQVKRLSSNETGITTIIYCGRVRSENDLFEGLALHRSIVEEEVNKEGTNITGILMGQVTYLLIRIYKHYSLLLIILGNL